MKRSLGRNGKWAAWAIAGLLLIHGGALAQAPEQHWQPTSNAPSNTAPNYQPSTAPASNTSAGAPMAGQYQSPSAGASTPGYQNPPGGAAAAGYQNPPQANSPGGSQQYPTIERRQPATAGQPNYGNQPPDNRAIYPQDPRVQNAAGQGAAITGPPVAGPIQGPPQRNEPPRAPFVLSPPEAAALDRLLTDWEKRNKEIHVLESKFFRWKYDNVFGKPGQPAPPPDEGILKFAAPDKGLMQIETKEPTKSEHWLCDGKSIYQWDYSQKVITEFVMPPELQGKGIGDGPLPFVFGIEAEKLKQRYFMRIITPPTVQNEVWLEAWPRYQQQAAEFQKVQVILQITGQTKALFPYAIQIFSTNGTDRIVYQLQSPSINPSRPWNFLAPDWWKFSMPSGWTKKTELPPPPVEAGLRPSTLRRR